MQFSKVLIISLLGVFCVHCAHSMHYGLEQVVVEAPGITPVAYTKLIPFLSNHHLDFLLVHCTQEKRDLLLKLINNTQGLVDYAEVDNSAIEQVVANRMRHNADKGEFYLFSSQISEDVQEFVGKVAKIDGVEVVAIGNKEDMDLAQQEIQTWKQYRQFLEGKNPLSTKDLTLKTIRWSAGMFIGGLLATGIPLTISFAIANWSN